MSECKLLITKADKIAVITRKLNDSSKALIEIDKVKEFTELFPEYSIGILNRSPYSYNEYGYRFSSEICMKLKPIIKSLLEEEFKDLNKQLEELIK